MTKFSLLLVSPFFRGQIACAQSAQDIIRVG